MGEEKLTTGLRLRGVLDMTLAFSSTLIYLLINLLLWDQSKSLDVILTYNLFVAIGFIVATFISSFISTKISVKWMYFIARLFPMLPLILLLFFSDNIGGNLYLIGVLTGFGQISINISRMTLYQGITHSNNKLFNLIYSFNHWVWGAYALIMPIVASLIVQNRNQVFVLITLISIHIVLVCIHLIWRIDEVKQEFYLFTLIRDSMKDERIKKIGLGYFLIGIPAAFTLGILDAISLEQLGGIDNWTYLTASLAVLTLIVSQLYVRVDIGNNGISKSIIMIVAMIYGIAPIALIFQFDSTIFVIFMIIKVFFDLMVATFFNTFINILEEQEDRHNYHLVAYQAFNDLMRGIGIFIVLFGLRLLPADLLQPQFLTIILAIISVVPFLFLQIVLGKSDEPKAMYFESTLKK